MVVVQVMIGGLMRCCMQTLDEEMRPKAEMPNEGDKLKCRYCSNRMIFSKNAWGWDRDATESVGPTLQ